MTRLLSRLVLRLLPREFRDAHRDEIDRLLAESDALYAADASRMTRARVAAAILADAARGAITLRADQWAPSRLVRDSWHDVRQSIRALGQVPGFTAAAVLTTAIGVGSAAAMFTVIDGVLLKPLPYRDGDRLVNIWVDFGAGNQSLPAVSTGDYGDYRQRATAFDELTAGSGGELVGATGVLTDGGAPERVVVSAVAANFFQLFGVQPIAGRTFTPAEDAPSGGSVVILSHALWTRRFNADPSIVGRTITLDGLAQRVVGVLPPFTLLLPAEAFMIRDADVWKPLQLDFVHTPPRNFTGLTVVGRLRRGISLAAAQADMDRIERQLHAEHAEHLAGDMRVRVVPLKHDIVKAATPTLIALQFAVAFVLLIACANVAHLLLSRGTTRVREMALRSALGATRLRLVRQLTTESLLIAGIGGAIGTWLASAAVTVLVASAPASLPRPQAIALDGRVLAFSIVATFVTGLLFGLIPALRSARVDAAAVLKSATRASSPMTAGRRILIACEVTMAVVLLIGTGLVVRSSAELQRVHAGFQPDGVTTIGVVLPRARYRTNPERLQFLEDVESRLSAIAGVEGVGAISQLPLTGTGPLSPYAYDARTAANWESATADGRAVTPGYFAAMGTTLLEGRLFDERDLRDGPATTIVVDRLLATRAWPGQSAVGKRLQVRNDDSGPGRFAEVVGVVESTRMVDLRRDARGQIFTTFAASGYPKFALVVRAAPGAVDASAFARAIASVDPELPLTIRPMYDIVDTHLSEIRFAATLMGLFGAIALTLVAVGLYGVISYSVAQRTREIGIRLALGDTVSHARRRIVIDGLAIVGASLVAGVLLALPLARMAGSLVYGVSVADPLTIASACAVVTLVGLAGTAIPALAITRVNPLTALRAE